jgi:Kef-type K+ transport system membrane component KefB/mannitol/fructose-specific phosphotransferase system IIA component (Ntr-type)
MKRILSILAPLVILLFFLPGVAMAGSESSSSSVDMTHRMMVLAIQLGVILLAARLGNIFFEKIKMPGVLGELVAGIILGPYALGHIPIYGFSQGLFEISGDLAVSPELFGLSAIAAIVLLFTVGLETNLGLLIRYSIAGLMVGIGGVAVSFFLGAGILSAYSESLFGYHVGTFTPIALFAGIVSTATSVGITARILSEKRKMDSPEGVTILSAAVIDDVIGIILLAVVMGVVAASKEAGTFEWSKIAMIAVKAVGVWLVATTVGLVASRKISFLLKWFGQRTSIAIMALGLALILAGLFEEFGLAMIIGAYVMGLSLSKSDIKHVIREKLDSIYEFLVPVFFFTIGMQINVVHMGNRSILVFAGVYSVVAILSKVVGCGLPAMMTGFNLRGAMRIGFGMAPRGEVGLIIAGIGLSTKLVTPELFAAMVAMVMINTLIAPPALVFLFRSPASGVRKSAMKEEKAGTKLSFDFPSLAMAEFFVNKLLEVFTAEGFFVHALGHEQSLNQARKDETVIDIMRIGTNLTFDCTEVDVPLINTAMYEAMAALEQAISELKKPLDVLPIGMRIQEQITISDQNLTLQGYLKPSLIVPELKGRTKEAVIDELIEVLARNGLVRNIKTARDAVWSREKGMSTGLQYGIAIPHGKTDEVNCLVCALGIKREGIDFDAMDGQPSTIFFLTLSPESKPAPHVQFMSTISQVLNGHGRDRLFKCKTAEEIYKSLVSRPPARVPTPPPAERPPKFTLSAYLKPSLVEPDLKGNTAEEIVDELLEMLDKENLIRDMQEARAAVLARENQMSTGLPEGIAIPHGRTNAVDTLACAVGIKRAGVDFGMPNGTKTHIIVMTLTPISGADPYLQFVAAIIRSLDVAGRENVVGAKTKEELFEALVGKSGSGNA